MFSDEIILLLRGSIMKELNPVNDPLGEVNHMYIPMLSRVHGVHTRRAKQHADHAQLIQS